MDNLEIMQKILEDKETEIQGLHENIRELKEELFIQLTIQDSNNKTVKELTEENAQLYAQNVYYIDLLKKVDAANKKAQSNLAKTQKMLAKEREDHDDTRMELASARSLQVSQPPVFLAGVYPAIVVPTLLH